MVSCFWKLLVDNGCFIVVVIGDYYIFGDMFGMIEVMCFVCQFLINLKGDLDQYFMVYLEDIGCYIDFGLYYLLMSIVSVLWDIFLFVLGIVGVGGQEFLILVLQMILDMLKKVNIVYFGYFSGFGLLCGLVFDVFGFQIGLSYDELIDCCIGKYYILDQGDIVGCKQLQWDFVYIVSLFGLLGMCVLIVSGICDVVVLQVVEIVSDW